MDKRTFTLLYKSMVRPHVEFANSVWCPYKIAQLAKFSGPTAANGRQYRQRHAASGPTLGRLNY